MRTITAEDAKKNFSRMLRLVREGVEFTVTDAGEPVAKVSSARPFSPRVQAPSRSAKEVLNRIDLLGARQDLQGASIRELIEDGRRF